MSENKLRNREVIDAELQKTKADTATSYGEATLNTLSEKG